MKWNIAQKLTGAFGIILIIISTFSIYTINTQTEYESEIIVYKNLNEQVGLAGEIRYNIGNVWQYLTDASLTGEEAALSEAGKKHKEAKDADNSMKMAGGVVTRGIELNINVESALMKINESAQLVASEIDQVAAASEEQSAASEQISKNIEGISNVTNETSTGIQQIANAAEDLNRLTNNLQEMISSFKIGDESSFLTSSKHNLIGSYN